LFKIIFLILISFTIFSYESEKVSILIEKSKKISFFASNFSISDEMVGDRLFSSKKEKKIIVEIQKRDNEYGLKVLNTFYPTTSIIIESEKGFKINNKKLSFKLAVILYKEDLYAVNVLPLEAYLAGIINSEISSKWPIESIKAQAVVSRTYAFRKKIKNREKPYDLNTTVLDQVYKGITHIDKVSIDAVKQTYGEVITYNHRLIEAFFFAHSGGKTEDGSYFNGIDVPYLKPRDDSEYVKDKPRSNWSYKIKLKDFTNRLKSKNWIKGEIDKIKIIKRSKSKRVLKLAFISDKTVTISGENLRQLLGYNKLFSTNFKIKKSGKYLIIEGHGSGHGVGMCQWGAFGMAKAGKTYKDIIHKYFTDVEIIKAY
jgi:stage II sporulation protein D